MSETMALPPFTDASAKKTPTVYFIDDSATMREVIKIAFRRENFNVITCGDAASALSQFDQNPPDAVITDVIMPDQDGYSVCTQIKQHEKFAHIPVILMSGVVNKTVADKAVGVKADELIRKPFQPQELIGRVKALLNPKSASAPAAPAERPALPSLVQPLAPSHPPASLSSFFAPPQPHLHPVSAIRCCSQHHPIPALTTSRERLASRTRRRVYAASVICKSSGAATSAAAASVASWISATAVPTHSRRLRQSEPPRTSFRQRAARTGAGSPLRRRPHKAPRRNRAS